MAYSVSKPNLLTRSEAGEFYARAPEAQWKVWQEQYPTQRFTQQGEVAEVALFLCSARAVNITITGGNFFVDGGLTALLPEC